MTSSQVKYIGAFEFIYVTFLVLTRAQIEVGDILHIFSFRCNKNKRWHCRYTYDDYAKGISLFGQRIIIKIPKCICMCKEEEHYQNQIYLFLC